MKCPKCQFENREGIKFCEECGAKMELKCPKCGAELPLGRKFCGGCGHDLSLASKPIPKELSFDEKLAKIQRYLPKDLTQKILSQRDKIEGERKQVTVMFCDMEGFTPLTEKLGSEEIYSLMDEVYEILIHKVHDYEGTVNEMTGDGIMALFGAPIALEDAPQRAIRSALAIHREINRFSDRIKQEKGIPTLKMRIGIHTGPVVVGTLGNDLRVEFKAVGDTVNLASRMEGLADPGTTYVTEDTFKLTEGFFRFEALGEKKVKGKEEPVKVYQVIAPSTRRTRFDVSAERGLTPFVGRERELELLLDGFERVKANKGQAFSIVSEAGCGKSRLLYEFRKAVANEDITFLEGKCLSYGKGVAYHPVIEILKSTFDIQEEEKDTKIREKVKAGLKLMGVDEPSTLPYLLELLSVKDSGIDQISMSPEAKKDRIIEACRRIVLKGSEIRPLIIAFEDLHWLDKSSEDVLKNHLESVPGSRILLIFTYRPEFVHTWGSKSYHNQLTLHRLSNRETLEMLTSILGTREIEKSLEEIILEKTEGVPFFIEEFIKSLRDLKIIEKKDNSYRLSKDVYQLTIPSTIQDVIMARVDSLPERAKEVLQTGSAIEREFSYPLINRVTGLPEKELLSNLSILKDSELLYEKGVYPQSNYIFKHALTREVVYDSILGKIKKKFHEEIGKAIEELCKDNLSEYYEVLAEHFIKSENYEKGAEYSRLAGNKAYRAGSLNEGIFYAEKRVACIEHLPEREDVQLKRIDSRVSLANRMLEVNHHIEAKKVVEPIYKLTLEKGLKKRLGDILIVMGSYNLFVIEDLPSTFRDLDEALKVSEETKSFSSSFGANYWLGCAFGWIGKFQKGAEHFQKAIEITTTFSYAPGISVSKATLATFCHFLSGEVNLQFQTTSQTLCIAEESGDIHSKAVAQHSHGCSLYAKGLLKEAESHLLEGIGLSKKIDWYSWVGWSHFLLGEIYSENGKFVEAKEHYRISNQTLEKWGLSPSVRTLAILGVIKSGILDYEKDIDMGLLYEYLKDIKLNAFEGWAFRCVGEILLNIDDLHTSEAERWIQNAMEADQRNRMMFHLGKDYALYAGLFKRRGDREKTRDNLGKAIEIIKECGADGWVEKYEKELAGIS
jgi:class 3 adenylate cyclase/tetratricopeptide (TPR) repeat protein